MAAIAHYHAAIGEGCTANYIAKRFEIHHETAREYFFVLFRKGWLKGHSSPATPRDASRSRRLLARR